MRAGRSYLGSDFRIDPFPRSLPVREIAVREVTEQGGRGIFRQSDARRAMASGSGRHNRNINWYRTLERSQRLKNAAPSGKTDRQLIDEHIATKGVTVLRPGTDQNTKVATARYQPGRRKP